MILIEQDNSIKEKKTILFKCNRESMYSYFHIKFIKQQTLNEK